LVIQALVVGGYARCGGGVLALMLSVALTFSLGCAGVLLVEPLVGAKRVMG
jgi:hypothetical protein